MTIYNIATLPPRRGWLLRLGGKMFHAYEASVFSIIEKVDRGELDNTVLRRVMSGQTLSVHFLSTS